MSSVAPQYINEAGDRLSEKTFGNVIDRWIFVFMAAFFIAITLTGFIPDSLAKLAAIEAGQRPPFPVVLHFHSVLMGSFLLLLFAQTVLAATGRLHYHQRLGITAFLLAPAIVVAGFVLIPTMYHQVWYGLQAAPVEARAGLQELLRFVDNIMLVQIRVGILFPILLAIALLARKTDSGLHKRMMFLTIAPALPAAIDRMTWLPHTFPESPLSADLYMLLALSPLVIWDVLRNRKIHKAYWIFLAFMVPSSIVVNALWDSDWWHATAPKLVGL